MSNNTLSTGKTANKATNYIPRLPSTKTILAMLKGLTGTAEEKANAATQINNLRK